MCSVVLCPLSSDKRLCTVTLSQLKENKRVFSCFHHSVILRAILGFQCSCKKKLKLAKLVKEGVFFFWLLFFYSLDSFSMTIKQRFFFGPASVAVLACGG